MRFAGPGSVSKRSVAWIRSPDQATGASPHVSRPRALSGNTVFLRLVMDSHFLKGGRPPAGVTSCPCDPSCVGYGIFSGKGSTVFFRSSLLRKCRSRPVFRDVFLPGGSFSGRGRTEKRGCRDILGDSAGCVAGFSMLEAAPTHACGS